MIDLEKLRRSAAAIFVVVDESIARDISQLLIGASDEIETLRDKLAKIKEHLLSAKEYIDATECIQPCDSYGVCFKCSIEGDILIALVEYIGETK